ncbi:MAG: type II toxin-antitoxin system HicA family toxin [Nostoc sp. RI_552]|uniref:type II toxin-antitoxin system HicA family toxin n=1 Tax=Umezakia ovalisporum TaxID=75695 RepID=UPI0026D70AB5|nr:type II toxin-antitoxin system HicA family toxin [Nostoc sp. RI_552]
MLTIPDFSYFAVPGFIPKMRGYPNQTSSLILHNKDNDQWDSVLRQEDADLINWLHNKTGKLHNIYFPYAPNNKFLILNSKHIMNLVEPAKNRIHNFLVQLGVEDVQEYMRDSNEWLSILFSLGPHHYRGAEIAASCFEISCDQFPIILLWSNLDSKNLIKLIPNSSDENMTEYVKYLYWSIMMATKDMSMYGNIPINRFLEKIQSKLDKSHHIKEYSQKIRSIEKFTAPKSIARILEDIADKYKDEFNDAILNFEDVVTSTTDSKSIIRLSDESKNAIIREMESVGFYKVREGGNHEVWQHLKLNKPTIVPRHRSLCSFVIRSIQRDIQYVISA